MIDFERVFEEIKETSKKNNLDLKIITLTNDRGKSRQLMNDTDNLINKLCKQFDIKCDLLILDKLIKVIEAI